MHKLFIIGFSLMTVLACKKNSSEPQFTVESIKRNTASEKTVVVGNDTYVAGYAQVSSNNQDAYVIKETSGKTVWAKYYDKSPDDSRGEALAIEGNTLIVAFSCTGGNTELTATQSSFQNSYGSGGGPKITFLARLNAQNGNIEAATFIGCKLNDGKTNTLRPEDNNPNPISILANGNIQFRATKAYDKGDGRLTPNIGADTDCNISGGKWVGLFNPQMQLLEGDCLP
ncbi:MAG: hypothetical protein MUC49_09600 [Raineya sp.]|jgi:hypothetical protein|nr:hypothetical protein [Raineya sp.]